VISGFCILCPFCLFSQIVNFRRKSFRKRLHLCLTSKIHRRWEGITMINRIVRVISEDIYNCMNYSFNSEIMNDSKALHHVLCQIDPGNKYTVEFDNIPVRYECGCESSKCEHTRKNEMCKSTEKGVHIVLIGNVCSSCANNY
jgi:hypothetical protein